MSGDEGHIRSEPSDGYPGMPRWVKAFGIVVLALVLAGALIMHVVGGEHGPGRHTISSQQR